MKATPVAVSQRDVLVVSPKRAGENSSRSEGMPAQSKADGKQCNRARFGLVPEPSLTVWPDAKKSNVPVIAPQQRGVPGHGSCRFSGEMGRQAASIRGRVVAASGPGVQLQ